MEGNCLHQGVILSSATVTRAPDGRYLARISLHCADCLAPLQFFGTATGIDPNGVRTSEDKHELRIAVGTPETLSAYYTAAVEKCLEPKVVRPSFTPRVVRKAV